MLLDCSIIDLKLAERRANGPSPIIAKQKGATMAKRICSIEGCGKPHEGKGFCKSHLRKFNLYGDPQFIKPRKKARICKLDGCSRGRVMPDGFCRLHHRRFKANGMDEIDRPSASLSYRKFCSADGCDRKHKAGGYCTKHYSRFQNRGNVEDTYLTYRRAINGEPERFIREICFDGVYICIDFPFGDGVSYGKLNIDGTTWSAHRFSLAIHVSPPPFEGAFALHAPLICKSRRCVNPNHLRWGTAKENTQDILIENAYRKLVKKHFTYLQEEG